MGAFEFFFSIYGLVLGLSVTVVATGAARAFKHRRTVAVGWKTPLLAVFVLLDIVTFWDVAWTNFRTLPFSYGLLVCGLVVAVVYFIAASLVFPEPEDQAQSMDDHLWANKRTVLLLLVLANILLVIATAWVNLSGGKGAGSLLTYAPTLVLYLGLILPAAFTRRAGLFGLALGAHVIVYLAIAILTLNNPSRAKQDVDPTHPPTSSTPASTPSS